MLSKIIKILDFNEAKNSNGLKIVYSCHLHHFWILKWFRVSFITIFVLNIIYRLEMFST